jgi:hypothetical protein
MRVLAAPGTRCPKEGKPRDYITDSTAVTVPDSAYYRRLVADGSLVEAVAETASSKAVKRGGSE